MSAGDFSGCRVLAVTGHSLGGGCAPSAAAPAPTARVRVGPVPVRQIDAQHSGWLCSGRRMHVLLPAGA